MTSNTTVPVKDEVYEKLSQDDQDRFDEISANGYTPSLDGIHWIAKNRGTGAEIGPVVTLATLRTKVFKAIQKAGGKPETPATLGSEPVADEIVLTEDAKGNTYLPGTEEIVDKTLANAVLEEYADKEAWKEAGKKKLTSKNALEAIAAAKRHLFYPDPNNSKDLIFKAGGVTCRIAKEFTVQVKTERTKEEKEKK